PIPIENSNLFRLIVGHRFQSQNRHNSDTIMLVVNDGFGKWRIVAIDPNLTVGIIVIDRLIMSIKLTV
ncbi:MAG TPA: hypothetical protein VIE65_15985, partial [Methylobacter sp.]